MSDKPVNAIRDSGDVFADMGFSPEEANQLNVKSSLITAIHDTIVTRKLTQKAAAQICGTDRPTLSKILRGRMESVTIDRLISILSGLGQEVDLSMTVHPRMLVEDTANAPSRRQ